MKLRILLFLAWAFVATTVGTAEAQAPIASISPYLVDDVAAAAYIDLAGIDVSAASEQLQQLEVWPPGVDVGQVLTTASQMAPGGVRAIYVLFRTSDLQHRGPTWIVALTDEADPQAVVEQLRALKSPAPAPQAWEAVDRLALGATNAEQLALLKRRRPGNQPWAPEASDALTQLTSHQAGCVVWGDADSRRVVREMFPALPEPFATIDGRLIADQLQWGGVLLDLSPQLSVRLVVRSADPDSAKALQRAADAGLDLLAQLPEESSPLPPESLQRLIVAMRPQLTGSALSVVFDSEQTAEVLRELVAPPLRAAQQAAQRNMRMNNFKQIALAFHIYHDKHKIFPSQANYDSQRRPLLSWRVHVLPYLEQQELYDQFHLDEPWDSAHNRTLIERMPDVYADPDAAQQRETGSGRTTVQIPIGAGTMFEKGTALPLKEVRDGTSNTVMLVDAAPERSVVWTQPADWQVDWHQPLAGLAGATREVFIVARADGSAHAVSTTTDPQDFAKLLTANGREPTP